MPSIVRNERDVKAQKTKWMSYLKENQTTNWHDFVHYLNFGMGGKSKESGKLVRRLGTKNQLVITNLDLIAVA